ncbi:receptor-type tyrosine-protein phosphatase alpha-like isoform X6 [Zophobas morio]|uniref:receptor-type tyrosine-protein phosphatase alpha-like isoform X6 n=1 Tax=Zophobas morio TaxID=2755281 RepID=UPI003082ACF2
MIFLVSTLVLFAVNNNCQEIITLQNETHLICVAKNKNSVMYTVPHIIGDTENTEVLLENDFWHHWTLNKSHDVPLAPVTDKRWEGFNTIHTDHYNISGSASFSIYFLNVPCGIRFKIYVDSGHYYISKTISDISWIHYTVNVVNGYVYIYENDRRLQVWRVNSNIPNVFIQTTCESTWKIHKYRVRVANKLSPAQVSLTIPPAISCLMFYVYLCPGCLLEIQASRNYSLQVKPDDTTKNGLFKSQEVLVEVNRNLNLVPQTLHGVKQTFWGIDIRKCPNIKLNKSIYEVQLSNNEREKNRTCEFLSPNSESPSRIAKVFPENQCEPGFLGQKCDLRCDELLGPEKTYCENHKICEKFSNNSICSCSWGFQEPLCVQPCMDGMWGLSCKRTCKHCQNCDKKTGECITVSGSIVFSNMSSPKSNHSTKAYFLLPKDGFINSTEEIIAYALFLFEEHVDIKRTSGSWNGPLGSWPSIPENSTQLTPNFWNPFTDQNHTCDFIIGDDSSCCKVHCYNTPLKSNTQYGLVVRALTNHAYNDSSLLFFHTASDDSYWFSIYFISLAVLISLIFIILILIRIMYKRRRRNKQPAIIQEVIMLTEDKKPLEDTVIDFDSLENRCLQPTFLTTLRTQFNLISGTVPHSSSRIGLQPENINKNKDRNRIIPFDLNRVILKPMEGVGTGDYINASYIDGYDRPKAYIACQSPKFYTVKDFWRMIWQQEVSVIIMATNFIECQKRMCAEYWPQRLSELYECGKIVVKLLKETTFEQYSHQELEVIYGNNVRTIHNFHLKWTINASSMFYPNNVLPIVKLIRQRYENSNGPIAVHSGYGTGRAGILILCDLALQMIKIDKKVDFFNLTKTLREQRPFIINKVECYLFVHLLVNEYFLEHRNPFQCTVGNNIKQQFKFVETLHQYDNIFQENSLQYCIPRLLFQSAVVARYGQTRKYLVSKGPKEDELVEFWKMVARQSVHCVLFLNKKFPLRVDITGSTEVVKLILTRVVNTTCGQMMEGSLLIYNRISREKYHDDNLYIFQFNNWKVNQLVPNSVDKFISVINHFRKVTAKEELALVSCSDGFTACGLFVVFSYIIEKYENEADIDVCNAIRNARRSGKLFLNRTRQLTFIYECIKNYREHHNKYEEIE